ncbi:MAG TPA: hypothetical protein VF235_07020 [Actinomycetota bacterium]
MVRFQRQPPGTAVTRAALLVGVLLAVAAAWLIVIGRFPAGGLAAAGSGFLLLLGGHRANHGLGGPVDRMLTELFDRTWDGAVLGAIAWASFATSAATAAGALVALSASFLSSYVRARGAALGYSVEESHVTRGLRYGLVSAGLLVDGWLVWTVWVAAGLGILATAVRTGQVAREERAA